MIRKLSIANYRSIRDLVLSLDQLNVVTGTNGSGKSNLYRALRLVSQTAHGSAVSVIAREGGLSSILWAGPQQFSRDVKSGRHPVEGTVRSNRINLRLGFSCDEFSYAIDYGISTQQPGSSMFFRDPEIKREVLWRGSDLWHSSRAVMDRKRPAVRTRNDEGQMEVVLKNLSPNDSVLGSLIDPLKHPELYQLREEVRSWRFYDHFRIDANSPLRQPQVGSFAAVLSNEGSNLPSAWQTICEIGDANRLHEHLEDAFPGSNVSIEDSEGLFALRMHQHGLLRGLGQAELSDGTLRYLFWLVALHTPRPPSLMVLNEPETSIHADLLPALARLIVASSEKMQIWVITHSDILVESLTEANECNHIRLEKDLGETLIEGEGLFNRAAWRWPTR
ncbi:MAG: AAA family ATPase [Gammaproteobacteria bacterium]|nr:AAA family ATPase [Gammaproteobacteria bacterium]